MRLFRGLNAQGGVAAVEAAAAALQDGLARLSGRGPYSLGELAPDEDDYSWLQHWAAELSAGTIYQTGWRCGALALMLISERARREAQEGHVWPVVAGLFSKAAERKFYAQGQPKSRLKELLVEAAVHLHLRHVFDRAVGLNWYLSIYLQFGFTSRGMLDNLPYWLVGGNLTDSISILRDGKLASQSFQRLWSKLRDYRKQKWRGEEELRHEIRANPWVLPAWEDDLVRLAREKLDLPDPDDQRERPPVSRTTGSHDANARLPVLQPPRLRWDFPETPVFCSAWSDPNLLGLTESLYRLDLGANALGYLFRQPGGGYRAEPPEILLPLTAPDLVVTLTDGSGNSVACQVFKLWDPLADVTVYRAKSDKAATDLAGKVLNRSVSYAILAADDLTVCPAQPVWRRLGQRSGRRLTLVSREWSTDLCVADKSGTVVWRPTIGRQQAITDEPAWARAVEADWRGNVDTIDLGRKAEIAVSGLKTDVEVISLRLCGKALSPRRGQIVTAEIEATPDLAMGALRLGIGLRRGSEHVHVHRELPSVILGAARFKTAGWEVLKPNSKLTVREGRERLFRCFLPNGLDLPDERVALVEGPRLAGWLGGRPGRIDSLAGLGGPLAACREPYNAPIPLFRLASAVIELGIIRDIEYHKQFLAAEVRLTRPIAPGPSHQIVWWRSDGDVRISGPEGVAVMEDGAVWRIPCPWPESVNLSVVGIAFEGRCLGSACPGKSYERVFEAMVPDEAMAVRTVTMVRWLHLPILLRAHESGPPVFAAFCQAHPVATLATWLFDDVPEDLSLVFDDRVDVSEGAWTALREIFAGWEPEPSTARSIVEGLARFAPSAPLAGIVQWLLPKEPMLTGRIVRGWFAAQNLTRPAKATAGQNVLQLVRQALGLRADSGGPEISRTLDDLLTQAEESTGRAENFFRELARESLTTMKSQRLSPETARNLEVALQIGAFRHYLGAVVLDWVAHHL